MAAVEHTRPKAPLIYNPKVRGMAYQAVLCAVIVFLATTTLVPVPVPASRGRLATRAAVPNANTARIAPTTM